MTLLGGISMRENEGGAGESGAAGLQSVLT